MRAKAMIPAGVLMALLATDAEASDRDFCASVPSACMFTGPWAPVLAADVCWSRTTGVATLRGSQGCPTGSWPYSVKYGDVDPSTGTVTAYVPLDDACTHPGICQPAELAPPNTTTAPMCCIGGTCHPYDGQCNGEVLLCDNGVTNEDGTVSCFDDEDA